jgi:hypothetical protein
MCAGEKINKSAATLTETKRIIPHFTTHCVIIAFCILIVLASMVWEEFPKDTTKHILDVLSSEREKKLSSIDSKRSRDEEGSKRFYCSSIIELTRAPRTHMTRKRDRNQAGRKGNKSDGSSERKDFNDSIALTDLDRKQFPLRSRSNFLSVPQDSLCSSH